MVEVNINGEIYEVIFLRKARPRFEPKLKFSTIITQCIIREKDGLYIGVGQATKDSRDKDDEIRGKRIALKYALEQISSKRERKTFWNKLKLGHNV